LSCDEASPIYRRNRSNPDQCDPEVMIEIENHLKTKLNIHDLNEVDIDTGYRKSKFTTLYKILGLLGVGAFGVVVEAVCNSTKEVIALKVISQENSKALFQTELMESQVINELQHKNIIIFKRILYSNYHVFIEMEKVNGGTLESFIKHNKKLNKIKK
jgi:serine/threonine protein kinase